MGLAFPFDQRLQTLFFVIPQDVIPALKHCISANTP